MFAITNVAKWMALIQHLTATSTIKLTSNLILPNRNARKPMTEILIKGLYLLVGLFIGYRVGRRMFGPMESYLMQSIRRGKKVVISVDDRAIMYELVDGKVRISSGYVETTEELPEGTDETASFSDEGK